MLTKLKMYEIIIIGLSTYFVGFMVNVYHKNCFISIFIEGKYEFG